MDKHHRRSRTMIATLALLSFPFCCRAEPPRANTAVTVVGQKVDSGLGDLPHYRYWTTLPARSASGGAAVRIVGEKLDSGLGALSGSLAMSNYAAATQLASSSDRVTRVHGEKLDSGLGELR